MLEQQLVSEINKKTKIEVNEHTIFVNLVRSMVPTSLTIKQIYFIVIILGFNVTDNIYNITTIQFTKSLMNHTSLQITDKPCFNI